MRNIETGRNGSLSDWVNQDCILWFVHSGNCLHWLLDVGFSLKLNQGNSCVHYCLRSCSLICVYSILSGFLRQKSITKWYQSLLLSRLLEVCSWRFQRFRTEMGSLKFELSLFDGSGDFYSWRKKIRALLVQYKLQMALQDPSTLGSSVTDVQKRKL